MKTAVEQAVGEQREDAVSHPCCQETQHGQRQSNQGFEEARTSCAGTFAALITRDIPGPSRLETFGNGVAGAPGDCQQDEGEAMDVPAGFFAWGAADGLGLPPNVGREKLVEATKQRTGTGKRWSHAHEPFLPEGSFEQPHSAAERLFHLRELRKSARQIAYQLRMSSSTSPKTRGCQTKREPSIVNGLACHPSVAGELPV